MQEDRRSRRRINNLDELLEATGCATADALGHELHAPIEGYLEIEDIDPERVTIVAEHCLAETLDYPFTLGAFWRTVDEARRLSDIIWRVRSLPQFYPDGNPDDATSDIAGFFWVNDGELATQIGAEWAPVDPEPVADINTADSDQRWFVSGAPPQVLLGFDNYGQVHIGEPEVLRTRLLGPAEIRRGETITVDAARPTRTALRSVARAVTQIQQLRRAQFAFCRYCRDLLPPEQNIDGACAPCARRWTGIIVD